MYICNEPGTHFPVPDVFPYQGCKPGSPELWKAAHFTFRVFQTKSDYINATTLNFLCSAEIKYVILRSRNKQLLLCDETFAFVARININLGLPFYQTFVLPACFSSVGLTNHEQMQKISGNSYKS